MEPPSWIILADLLHNLPQLLSAPAAPSYPFLLRRQLLSLSHVNQPLLTSSFSSAAPSPLSAFKELKRVRAFALDWTRLCLKAVLWLIYSGHWNENSVSVIKLFHLSFLCSLELNFSLLSRTFTLHSHLGYYLAQDAQLLAYLGFQHAFLTKCKHSLFFI